MAEHEPSWRRLLLTGLGLRDRAPENGHLDDRRTARAAEVMGGGELTPHPPTHQLHGARGACVHDASESRRKGDDKNLVVLPKSLQGSLKSPRGKSSHVCLLVAWGLTHENPRIWQR